MKKLRHQGGAGLERQSYIHFHLHLIPQNTAMIVSAKDPLADTLHRDLLDTPYLVISYAESVAVTRHLCR